MICLRVGFPVHNPLTAKGLHQGQGGVKPGRDGKVDHVQHKVKESGVSGTCQCLLLLHVVVIELGDEPAGPHQLDHGGTGVVVTHLGLRDVASSCKIQKKVCWTVLDS